jgi:hypothetical protein
MLEPEPIAVVKKAQFSPLLSCLGARHPNPARAVIIGRVSGPAHHRSRVRDRWPLSLSLTVGKTLNIKSKMSVSLEIILHLTFLNMITIFF